MHRKILILIFSFFLLLSLSVELSAQCSVCTKTAQQMGEQPAKGMNSGIIYLAAMPLALVGFISFRWWKSNKGSQA